MTTKKSLFGLSILILFMNFGCNDNKSDLDLPTYEGNAKLKRMLLYPSLYITSEYEYDNHGRISKVSTPKYDNGTIVGTVDYNLYAYNASGQLISISNFVANTNTPSGYLNLQNHVYTYASNGLKEKQYIEYPQINSVEYTLYFYKDNKLEKAERYDHKDELKYYTTYEYNGNRLTKETLYSPRNEVDEITNHLYSNGLNTKTEVYRGNHGKDKLREIAKTYDSNNNLVMLESTELAIWSSASSYTMKYEYY